MNPTTSTAPRPDAVWPALPLSEWSETRDALFAFGQVIGKVRLALEPMLNHWWQVPFYLSARGLTTSLMHTDGGRGLELVFDFVEGVLRMETTEGTERTVALRPMSVAEFHSEAMTRLGELGVDVRILARPVEVPVSVPFADDTRERAYDPRHALRYWRALVQIHQVMVLFRSRFVGKASPVHYFWGAGDLAATRFSGRRAPRHPGGVPNCADWVQELAYSHEVSSCGYWPGGSEEGAFYAYAYPEPPGFADRRMRPAAAAYDVGLGEFLLPYADVRSSEDPAGVLLTFFQGAYEAAAELGGWDRAELELVTNPVQ